MKTLPFGRGRADNLRLAVGRDALPISKVYLAAWDSALSDLPKVHTDQQVQTWIQAVVVPGTTVWVAESNGEVAGFLSLDGESIEQMYVHPNHQNRGIGTALLNQARRLSPTRLQLFTFARNSGARRFYERHGFAAVKFGQDNEENEPDVLYEWTA